MKEYKVLFITGHRKSGTSMLNNLFDGHEDFLVYPNDITILYAYFPNFIGKKFSFIKKKKRLLEVIEKSLKKTKKNKIFNKENFVRLISKDINHKNIDNKELIFKVILKNFIKLSKRQKFKYVVFKETSLGLFIEEMSKWLKDIKFIQIVRDPRDNFSSMKSGYKKYYQKIGESYKILLSSMINRAFLDFETIDYNQKVLGKKSFYYLKFENLVLNPKIELKKICKFLMVKFDNTLLFPTVFGKNVKGNNFEGKKLYKISSANVNRWKKRLDKKEIEIIEFYFKDILKKFNYKKTNNVNMKSVKEYYIWLNNKFYYNDSFK
jgi:hypothetical protein